MRGVLSAKTAPNSPCVPSRPRSLPLVGGIVAPPRSFAAQAPLRRFTTGAPDLAPQAFAGDDSGVPVITSVYYDPNFVNSVYLMGNVGQDPTSAGSSRGPPWCPSA